MNYLIVVAHPDDEALGAGASIYKWTKEGHTVDVCIMCAQAKARAFRPENEELDDDMRKSTKMLGIRNLYLGDFPNIEMNAAPHLHLVQFIEKAIVESKADIIVTHHPADTNNDHLHTALACDAAVRLFQRRVEVKPLSEVWYMEALSATDWNINNAMNPFRPNTFVEVGKDGVEQKLKALAQYRGVMRPYPHPRSEEVVTGLAAYRGSQAGCCYAEAFECAFRRVV